MGEPYAKSNHHKGKQRHDASRQPGVRHIQRTVQSSLHKPDQENHSQEDLCGVDAASLSDAVEHRDVLREHTAHTGSHGVIDLLHYNRDRQHEDYPNGLPFP